MNLTDEQFIASAREMATALVTICERKGIDPGDSAQLVGAACAEAIAAFVGHASAAERLRDIADLAELQILKAH